MNSPGLSTTSVSESTPDGRAVPQSSLDFRLEPEQFYWAVLDTKSLGNRRPSTRSLDYLFEAVLPLAIDEVHAVYERIDRHSFIACGMEKQRLEEQVQSHTDEILTLAPRQLPSYFGEDFDLDPALLNFLKDTYTPRRVRRLQSRWLATAAMLMLLLTVILVLGLERRVQSLNQLSENLRTHQSHIAAEIFGESAMTSALPPSLQLTAELRELRSTRSVDVPTLAQSDAAMMLADLLSHWPSELSMQTNSITITGEAITIQADLNESSDVQMLAQALEPMDTWSLRQPRVDSAGESVRATIQLARNSNVKSPGAAP